MSSDIKVAQVAPVSEVSLTPEWMAEIRDYSEKAGMEYEEMEGFFLMDLPALIASHDSQAREIERLRKVAQPAPVSEPPQEPTFTLTLPDIEARALALAAVRGCDVLLDDGGFANVLAVKITMTVLGRLREMLPPVGGAVQ